MVVRLPIFEILVPPSLLQFRVEAAAGDRQRTAEDDEDGDDTPRNEIKVAAVVTACGRASSGRAGAGS